MAIYRSVTFEDGSLTGANGYDSASSRAILGTDRPLTGSFHAEHGVETTATTYFSRVAIPTANRNAVYCSWYIRFFQLPSSGDSLMFMRLATSSDNAVSSLELQRDTGIQFRDGTGVARGDTFPVVVGQTYRIDLSYVRNTGSGDGSVTVAIAEENGSATTIYTASGLTLTQPVEWHIGTPVGGVHLWFAVDEIRLDDASIPALGALNDPAYKGTIAQIGSIFGYWDGQKVYSRLGYRLKWTNDADYLTFNPSGCDFILAYYPTSESLPVLGPWLKGLSDSGWPILAGVNWSGIGNSQTHNSYPYYLRIGGPTKSITTVLGNNDIEIIDNSHPITDAFPEGKLNIYTNGTQWGASVDVSQPYVGDILAYHDPDWTSASLDGNALCLVADRGILDLDSNAVGARIVAAGWMYGYQASSSRPHLVGYTSSGSELMGAVAQWLTESTDEPVPPSTLVKAVTFEGGERTGEQGFDGLSGGTTVLESVDPIRGNHSFKVMASGGYGQVNNVNGVLGASVSFLLRFEENHSTLGNLVAFRDGSTIATTLTLSSSHSLSFSGNAASPPLIPGDAYAISYQYYVPSHPNGPRRILAIRKEDGTLVWSTTDTSTTQERTITNIRMGGHSGVTLDEIRVSSDPNNVPAIAAPPTGVGYELIGPRDVRIFWSAITGASRYVVEYSTDGGTTWYVLDSVLEYMFIHVGRALGTTYQYRIKAKVPVLDEEGAPVLDENDEPVEEETEPSEPVESATPETELPNPPPPVAEEPDEEDPASRTSITVTWDAVEGATSYDLRYSGNGGATWTTIVDATSPHTIEGLSAGKTYLIEVRAVSANGLSEWSDPVEGSTLGGDVFISTTKLGIHVGI